MSIAVAVREARTEAGLTQEQLAQAAGVTLRTIARVELGENEPRIQVLRQIAEALGVSAADLLDPVAS